MICRKRDMLVLEDSIPAWHLRQWCSCGRWVAYTVTLPIGLFDHARLSWRDIAAKRLRQARREIREHIALDERVHRREVKQ